MGGLSCGSGEGRCYRLCLAGGGSPHPERPGRAGNRVARCPVGVRFPASQRPPREQRFQEGIPMSQFTTPATKDEVVLLLGRLALGAIFVKSGLQKLLGLSAFAAS